MKILEKAGLLFILTSLWFLLAPITCKIFDILIPNPKTTGYVVVTISAILIIIGITLFANSNDGQ